MTGTYDRSRTRSYSRLLEQVRGGPLQAPLGFPSVVCLFIGDTSFPVNTMRKRRVSASPPSP